MSDINTNVYDNALKMKVLQNLLNDRKPKETKKIAGQMVGEKTEKSISGNNEKIV